MVLLKWYKNKILWKWSVRQEIQQRREDEIEEVLFQSKQDENYLYGVGMCY